MAKIQEINLDRNFITPHERNIEFILQFTNPTDAITPQSFPAGPVQVVYRMSSDGLGVQPFGTFRIPHTNPGDVVNISMGTASRVRGNRKRIDIRLDRKGHVLSETFEIDIKSKFKGDSSVPTTTTEQTITVIVEEQFLRWRDWK